MATPAQIVAFGDQWVTLLEEVNNELTTLQSQAGNSDMLPGGVDAELTRRIDDARASMRLAYREIAFLIYKNRRLIP